jgi:hypothetical protein
MTGQAFIHDSRHDTAELEARWHNAVKMREAAQERYEDDSPIVKTYLAREADAEMRFRRRVESPNP